jgi:DUF1365 family protein
MYEGQVVHERRTQLRNLFRYSVYMWLVDLDELDQLVDDSARLDDMAVLAFDREAVPAQEDRALQAVPQRVEHAVADSSQLGRDVVRDVQDVLHRGQSRDPAPSVARAGPNLPQGHTRCP